MSKRYTEAEIRAKLASDSKWVERALLRLYERQTTTEQNAEQTINHNLMGFQPCDARMFTSFAKWIKMGRKLSPKQLAYTGCIEPGYNSTLRRRMWRNEPAIAKYARQLLIVMEEDAKKGVGNV